MNNSLVTHVLVINCLFVVLRVFVVDVHSVIFRFEFVVFWWIHVSPLQQSEINSLNYSVETYPTYPETYSGKDVEVQLSKMTPQ